MMRILQTLRTAVLAGLVFAAIAISPAEADAGAFDLGFHVPQGDSLHLQAAAEAGADFVVAVFSWRDIEPAEGYWYWEQPDAAMRGAQHYGLKVIARLDRAPDWALSGSARTPWRLDAYARFAAQTAERYGDRLAGVIVWNEPNLALEWNGQEPDPAGYAKMLRAAYPAVKGVAPDLPVAMAGLAFTLGDGTSSTNDLDFLQAVYAHAGGDFFDVVALHPYGFGLPPEAEPSADVLNFRRLEFHRRIMAENGDAAKPAWITEMGWRTSAPDPADAWQVVTPARQAGYSVRAMQWAESHYAWLERLAFWEINGGVDKYGYALWQGAEQTTATYRAIAGWAATRPRQQDEAPEMKTLADGALEIDILAADTIVRLGGVGTLHPHWVHLQRGEGVSSLAWSGEFYIPADEEADYELLIETMQIDDPRNELYMNGDFLVSLQRRPRLDSTSTWVTQRFQVPASMIRPGPNLLEVRSGPRNPVRQSGAHRHDNFQVRHIRLALAEQDSTPLWAGRRQIESPGSWGEINRLRLYLPTDESAPSLWVTSNANGGLWASSLAETDGDLRLENQAGNRADLVFVDVLATEAGEIAATDRGLYWRNSGTLRWLPVPGAPEAYTYSVVQARGRLYAGVEGGGVWSSVAPTGAWQSDGLEGLSVLDLAVGEDATVYAGTDAGIFHKSDCDWLRMPDLPADAYTSRQGAVTGDFVGRLHVLASGAPVVVNQNHAWVWEDGWRPYGPAELQGTIFDVSIGADGTTLLASDRKGLWAQDGAGQWRRLDGGFLDGLEVVGGLMVNDVTFAATTNGLMAHDPGGEWSVVEGMTSVVTDIEIIPGAQRHTGNERGIWVAGTQTGVYRSIDQGGTWERISPPWAVWDLALAGERLYVGRRQGLAWTDTLLAELPTWHETAGLGGVTFFRIHPDRFDADVLWGGTWGNNIGVSTDRGSSIASLNNGLETLSALAIWQHETPGQYTIGTIEGLYRTDDGGETWFKLPGPLAQQTVFSVLQTADGLLWAGATDGLWRSIDYGTAWSRVEDMPVATVLQAGHAVLGDGALLWAATEGRGVWISEDGGRTWALAGLDGLTVFTVAPDGEGSLLAATAHGLYAMGTLLDGENR